MGEAIITARQGFVQEEEQEIPVDTLNCTLVAFVKDSDGLPVKNALVRAEFVGSNGRNNASNLIYRSNYTNRKGMCYFQINSSSPIRLRATGELKGGGMILDHKSITVNHIYEVGNIVNINLNMPFMSTGGLVLTQINAGVGKFRNVNGKFLSAKYADVYIIGGGGGGREQSEVGHGGGGALNYHLNYQITKGVNYPIIIPGAQYEPNTGGTVSAFGLSAVGGTAAEFRNTEWMWGGDGGGTGKNKGGDGWGTPSKYDGGANCNARYNTIMNKLNSSGKFYTYCDTGWYVANETDRQDFSQVDLNNYGSGQYTPGRNNLSNYYNGVGVGGYKYRPDQASSARANVAYGGGLIVTNLRKS